MNFNKHLNLEGQHAFLSPSKPYWLNYDDEKLDRVFLKAMASAKGTELHAFACQAIRLGIKLPKINKTLNSYINDAIGYKMETEQVLYYSNNCFGTADAISFRKNLLRIHDLKTGSSPASMRQLETYSALFCLEYDFSPMNIDIELRLYQSDEILIHIPLPEDILEIMNKIIISDKRIEKLRIGE